MRTHAHTLFECQLGTPSEAKLKEFLEFPFRACFNTVLWRGMEMAGESLMMLSTCTHTILMDSERPTLSMPNLVGAMSGTR